MYRIRINFIYYFDTKLFVSEVLILFFKHIPKIFAVSYAIVGLAYWFIYFSLLPYWWLWLLCIGILYGLKDYYLEGYEVLPKEKLDEYPKWMRNFVEYGLDGHVKVKRRILMDSK